jgi:hypothetical protein
MKDIEVIYGVDFSGSEREAGRLIWICRLSLTANVPLVESCIQAEQLPDSGARRALCLPALCRFIAGHDSRAIFGLDFPFSLPGTVLGGSLLGRAGSVLFQRPLSIASHFGDSAG